MNMLKRLHYWLAFVSPWPVCLLARYVDRLMAVCEARR